ncbi:hypothetical protein EYF80_036318 [Liparis tanakae]|uniref:Uncharacterized protein n=1 Tax=Liparis tanakae TaxID=230148 RepID=A0A4Z2GJ44_9TELE|nr:hypothetical protein EYF80_036318 [Liparis tanakae]
MRPTVSLLLVISGWPMASRAALAGSPAFSQGDAVVPHVELLVHRYRFIDAILQKNEIMTFDSELHNHDFWRRGFFILTRSFLSLNSSLRPVSLSSSQSILELWLMVPRLQPAAKSTEEGKGKDGFSLSRSQIGSMTRRTSRFPLNRAMAPEREAAECIVHVKETSHNLSMTGQVKSPLKSYLAQFVCQQVSQKKSIGGVSHQVAIFAHDFDFFNLITIIGLQDHPGSCREVPHYHLQKKKERPCADREPDADRSKLPNTTDCPPGLLAATPPTMMPFAAQARAYGGHGCVNSLPWVTVGGGGVGGFVCQGVHHECAENLRG